MSTSLAQTEFGEPVWAIAELFPEQGRWDDEGYLSITDSTNRYVELVDGFIEVLEMPTATHQLIVAFLHDKLRAAFKPGTGRVILGPYRVFIRTDTFREPDVLVYLARHLDRLNDRFGGPPDLAVEIVSADAKSQKRDYEAKRVDYAQAGVEEYWLVDPLAKTITVLALDGDAYAEHGVFKPGATATSKLLDAFSVDVDEVFASAHV